VGTAGERSGANPIARAAIRVASSPVAGRVADRALERPRHFLATAQQVGVDALGLLRAEAELAQLEVQDKVPDLVRSGTLAVTGLVLVGITPALLVTAGVLWLGPEIGYAGAALLFAALAALTGALLARAGVAMVRRVSFVPTESLARIEAELARMGEALRAAPEPATPAGQEAAGEPEPPGGEARAG
jgi:hypothetical protein